MDPRLEGKALLESMIAPMEAKTFMETVWERKARLFRQPGEQAGEGPLVPIGPELFSSADIEEMARKGLLEYGRDVDVTLYKDGKRETRNRDGIASWEDLRRAFHDDRCSIRLLCPQAYHEALYRVLQSLEDFFGCFVGSNVYYTPAASAGFAPHFDDVEILVCQVEGAKLWRIYAPDDENTFLLPRHSSADFSQEEVGEPTMEVTLRAGDMLYMPRGWTHQAVTLADSDSLHVTVSTGLHRTWYDLMKMAMEASLESMAADTPSVHRSLPHDTQDFMGAMHSYSEDERRESFEGRLDRFVGTMLKQHFMLDPAADQMTRRHIRERLPPLAGARPPRCIPREEITSRTKVRLRHPRGCHMTIEAGHAVIYSAMENSRRYMEGAEVRLEFPLCVAPVFEEILERFPRSVELWQLEPMEGETESEDSVITESGDDDGGDTGPLRKVVVNLVHTLAARRVVDLFRPDEDEEDVGDDDDST